MRMLKFALNGRLAVFSGGLILIALFLVPCLALDANPISGEEIFQKMAPMVVSIHVKKNNGESVTGTGFLYEKSGFGVTAWHVLQNAASVEAKFISGITVPIEGFIDYNAKRDIVMFPIDVKISDLPGFMKGTPKIGSKVYSVGSPKGMEFSISDGILSQVREIGGIKQYQISCPISGGNSGGPILNDSGEVIGICSWQITEGQNLNFACPVEYVSELDGQKPITKWSQLPKTQLRDLSRQSPLETAEQLEILRAQLPELIKKLEEGDVNGYVQAFFNPPELKERLTRQTMEQVVNAVRGKAPLIIQYLKSIIQKEPVAITKGGVFVFDLSEFETRPNTKVEIRFIFNRAMKRFFLTFKQTD